MAAKVSNLLTGVDVLWYGFNAKIARREIMEWLRSLSIKAISQSLFTKKALHVSGRAFCAVDREPLLIVRLHFLVLFDLTEISYYIDNPGEGGSEH